jgi:hypothetical protein
MIDIKLSAEEKALAKELRQKTQAAYHLDVSIAVLGTRVLVLPIMEEEKESLIFIDEKTKQDIKGNALQRAIVKECGDAVTSVIPGDIVFVYPNQFEATIALNGVGYLVYQERSLIAKDKAPVIPSSIQL